MAGLLLTVPLSGRAQSLPTLDQVLASKQDLWGLAAMQQPNGPSYEFFASLLPPLRYVNTDFRYYPIILSAPSAMHKVRFISNGSGVNLRAGTKTWKEQGIPLEFHVGPSNEVFGADPARLHGPAYEKGYLPIVELSYESAGATYEQEAFAPVHALSDYGVVLVRFRIRAGKGTIVAQVNGGIGLKADNNMLFDTNRQPVLVFDRRWAWDPEKSTLTTKPSSGDEVHLAIATLPLPAKTDSRPLQKLREDFGNCANGKTFEREQRNCQLDWQTLLDRGTRIETPEALVNNAWRSLIAGCFSIAQSNAMNYSAGNQYQRLYQAECGDAARALALFGYTNESGAMLARLFDYTRDGLEFHNAGFKLQAFSHWYWLTRDSNAVQTLQPKWEKELNLILNGREKESGLFPKERYCGDIATRVHSLNPNASCWRGLRDFAAVLDDMGESRRAAELTRVARGFRVAISNAVVQSEDRSTQPPFVPLMLFGEEKAYDHLTSTMVGSYWNLLAPYVIGSGVLPDRSRWMVDYLQEHGGICMGMIRFDQHSGLFANVDALDDLYGIRYTLKLLELDEVDRALVSFYGKLAQGLTRDTFIG
ncbi:MAG TPA: hypothetical protein VLT36_00645, partial [Candidatus Dormibacteraeota bacterium]|nr:hypothetical protein [Candidatus Dormibacteraeota bacterium]